MHAISSYRGNRPTHKHRPPARPQQTGPITIHCAAKLCAQCNNDRFKRGRSEELINEKCTEKSHKTFETTDLQVVVAFGCVNSV